MLQLTSTLVIGGLGVFSNIIISSFGFSVLQTQLLNIAQGAATIIVMVGGATLAQTTKQTLLVMHVSTVTPGLENRVLIFFLGLDYSTYYWHSSDLFYKTFPFNPGWAFDSILLHAVLSCSGKLDLFSHLTKHSRPNQEINCPHNNFHCMGCWKHDW
jgi:hypothetical protein